MKNTKFLAVIEAAIQANTNVLEALRTYLVEGESEEVIAPTAKPAAKKSPAKKEPVVAEAEEVEETEEEEAEEEQYDLDAMKLAELKALAKELDVHVPKDTKIAIVRDMLREVLEGAEEAEAEVEEEEEESAEDVRDTTFTYEDEEEGEVTVDLSEYSLKELKDFAEGFEIEIPKTAKKLDAVLEVVLDALDAMMEEDEEEEDAGETDEDFQAEEDIEAEYGLDEFSTEELAEILTEHGLKASGKRAELVERIAEALDEGVIEFEEEEGE